MWPRFPPASVDILTVTPPGHLPPLAMNDVTEFDPVQVLVDEAVKVLCADDPRWAEGEPEYKERMLEDLKERTLRRVTRPGYFIFSMIVNHKVLICHAPLTTGFDLEYNPFRCSP